MPAPGAAVAGFAEPNAAVDSASTRGEPSLTQKRAGGE